MSLFWKHVRISYDRMTGSLRRRLNSHSFTSALSTQSIGLTPVHRYCRTNYFRFSSVLLWSIMCFTSFDLGNPSLIFRKQCERYMHVECQHLLICVDSSFLIHSVAMLLQSWFERDFRHSAVEQSNILIHCHSCTVMTGGKKDDKDNIIANRIE
jgi:hypothetical protein